MASELDPPTAPANDADPGLPPADDPGGAHAKGYSADTDPHAPAVTEPIPLADAPPGGIHVPERDDGVQPTGRRDAPDDPHNRIVESE
jgi:hypothetical protein